MPSKKGAKGNKSAKASKASKQKEKRAAAIHITNDMPDQSGVVEVVVILCMSKGIPFLTVATGGSSIRSGGLSHILRGRTTNLSG